MFEPPEPQSDSESEGIDQPPTHADLRPAGGGVRAIVTHRGPTTGGGGGAARNSSTPRTYDRRGGGAARNSSTPRTYDRRGCLKKVRLDAAPDAGQGFEKADRTNGHPISALC